MSAGSGALDAKPSLHRLRRRALALGVANAIDYALQFLLPVVLVRFLDAADFGQYRLVWLAAGTAMAVVTQSMAGSLYYLLPRTEERSQRLYINQTLAFLAFAGLAAAWAFSAWNPWLPGAMHAFERHGALVPGFVFLWVVASFLDLLPTIEERVRWQAGAIVGLSALRAVALSTAAVMTGELGPVLWMTFLFVAFKVGLLLAYVARHHGLRGPLGTWRTFVEQLRLAAPFSASGALYGLRAQADQWVAATLFSVGTFASFSIAAVLGPLVNLVRQSVVQAFLPSMSKFTANGDMAGMIDLNRRANVLGAALVYPLLALAFAFAEDIVTVVYTGTYLDAAPVMRIYIVGLIALVVEMASMMLLLREGPYAMRVNLAVLVFSVVLSWIAARRFGLAGAALGSVLAVYADGAATLWRIALRTGMTLRRLQDWRALGRSLLLAALAAALARGVVEWCLAGAAPLARLGAGAVLLSLAYAAMHWRFLTSGNWRAAAGQG